MERTGKIQQDYESALRILKPSKAQLEHGLELHKNSLVFDTYGLMPRAAVDGAVIANAINNHASFLELQDMREDMSMSRMAYHERERKEFENTFFSRSDRSGRYAADAAMGNRDLLSLPYIHCLAFGWFNDSMLQRKHKARSDRRVFFAPLRGIFPAQ